LKPAKPGVTAPILGVTKIVHLETAAAALDVRPSGEEVSALEAHCLPHPVAGHG
jgi:1-deoxyxylulose-5-phosphate synthase